MVADLTLLFSLVLLRETRVNRTNPPAGEGAGGFEGLLTEIQLAAVTKRLARSRLQRTDKRRSLALGQLVAGVGINAISRYASAVISVLTGYVLRNPSEGLRAPVAFVDGLSLLASEISLGTEDGHANPT